MEEGKKGHNLKVGAVAMARPGRPASEGYQSSCYSVRQSVSRLSAAGIEGIEDEGPIFSLSKSSMDVVMATGPPHKRDPAWTGIDLRRSSSTNTHSEQKLQSPMRQQISNLQLSLAAQNMEARSPPALSEHWMANMQRWSRSSGSTHSRSSTPDTIVWRAGSSRPCSLTQETPCSTAPDSPISKPASPITMTSPFMSPLMTPTLTPLPAVRQEVSPTISHLLQLTSAEDEGFLENNLFSFQYPSPVPCSASLEEEVASDPGSVIDAAMEEELSPDLKQTSEVGGATSPVFNNLIPHSEEAEVQETDQGASVCHLDLPWQPEQRCPIGRSRRSPLAASLSDSQLGECCRCSRGGRREVFREEATMTSQLELADAAVQTLSPVSSWWNLKRNTSNMGSHSILGSPPGSRLNLKSSVGSNSNLVSPSSSMFPVSSGEEEEERREEDPTWNVNSPSGHDLERRRSCLKIQSDEKDDHGRRSSMKQVQWDENGMTWDVHGASVDPEVMSEAIRKHLELQNSPKPAKRPSKKKKAPKPPLISNVVKAIAPELNPPVMTSTCAVERETKEMPEADGAKEEEAKTEEPSGRISRAEGDDAKDEGDEVYGEEAASHPKSPSHGSSHGRTKSVIWSLRRPGWCGGSRKADE